jgi:polyhydroxyalkanoate synthesis repressor PhaR
MTDEALQIKRYPNRRFYARHVKKYVSLEDIERWIREGHRVHIIDSQSGDDLTRSILTQLLIERHPEKVALFPTELLHFMIRANDVMSDFLRNYFRDSLTYLEFLQSPTRAAPLAQPMRWMQNWFEASVPGMAPMYPSAGNSTGDDLEQAADEAGDTSEPRGSDGSQPSDGETVVEQDQPVSEREKQLADRIAELENRIHRLESQSEDVS